MPALRGVWGVGGDPLPAGAAAGSFLLLPMPTTSPMSCVFQTCVSLYKGTTPALRDVWEATSFRLERLQAAEATVAAEQAGLAKRQAPQWRLPYTPEWTPPEKLDAQDKVSHR